MLFVIRALSCGGAERQLIELVRALDKGRFGVVVATFYDGGPLAAELRAVPGVRAVSLGKRGRWDLARFLVRFAWLARRLRPDVAHGYMGVSNELTLLARLLCGCRAVWGIRGSACDFRAYNDWARGFAHWLGGRLSRFADGIIVNSESGRRAHRAQGYAGGRMRVIHNGIDTTRFRPDAEAGRRIREQWGIAPQTPLIGMIARLDPMKDHPVFLRAAAWLLRRKKEVRFVCVGNGPATRLRALRELAGELGIADRVQWFSASEEVAAIYNALTVATLCSRFGEGFPNVLAEAAACGIPTVATDVGDAAVIVDDPARIVPPGCPERLAQAWEPLLEESETARTLRARQQRERIAREFGLARLARRTECALLETVQCPR